MVDSVLAGAAVAAGLYKSRGSNLISNSSRTKNIRNVECNLSAQCILITFLVYVLKNKYINITSPSADMVRLYVNVQFQVKPLSTGTSSSQTKKFF